MGHNGFSIMDRISEPAVREAIERASALAELVADSNATSQLVKLNIVSIGEHRSSFV